MRYLPLTAADRRDMLAAIGVGSAEDLYKDVPPEVLLDKPVDLPPHASETEVEQAFVALAMKNLSPGCAPFFLGAGAYRHQVPAIADHLIQRGEFLTAYTPYQPEVSQGTLQYLFEFQTQVALITGMEVANASLYDGATGCAEAVTMAVRATRRNKAILSGALHPHYGDVAKTMAGFLGIEMLGGEPDWRGDEDLSGRIDKETACVVVQNPGFFGHLRDYTALGEACHAAGALLVIVVNEVVSLGAVKSPGEMGADIVTGDGQSLGVPLAFGGPTIGLFAARQKYLRQMPGRLAGITTDADGRRGFVLTLSTREQHIRREKATSNICTNSGLCALAFSIHLSLLGEEGFKGLAGINHAYAVTLAAKLAEVNAVEVLNDTFFNEFTVRLPKPAAVVVDALADRNVLGGVPVSRLLPGRTELENLLLVAATEVNTEAEMDAFVKALEEVL